MADPGVGRLGADGVGLAVHLLQEEVEAPALTPPVPQHGTELGQVAPQPRALLAHVRPVRQDGHLLL